MKKETDKLQQKNILRAVSVIPTGRINARSMKNVGIALDVDDRTVRRLVELARLAGYPICGDDSGYYLPSDDGELKTYFFRARARANSSASVVSALKDVCVSRGIDVNNEKGDDGNA